MFYWHLLLFQLLQKWEVHLDPLRPLGPCQINLLNVGVSLNVDDLISKGIQANNRQIGWPSIKLGSLCVGMPVILCHHTLFLKGFPGRMELSSFLH